ncbi:MAG: hypothetical protein MdMp024_1551 [Bacteroidales bacterium]
MGLHKGQTGNPNGRPKGSPNKVTADLREWIKDLLEGNREQFTRDFEALEPYQRLIFWEKLLAYVLPKPVAEKEEKQQVEGIELRVVYPDGHVRVVN